MKLEAKQQIWKDYQKVLLRPELYPADFFPRFGMGIPRHFRQQVRENGI